MSELPVLLASCDSMPTSDFVPAALSALTELLASTVTVCRAAAAASREAANDGGLLVGLLISAPVSM